MRQELVTKRDGCWVTECDKMDYEVQKGTLKGAKGIKMWNRIAKYDGRTLSYKATNFFIFLVNRHTKTIANKVLYKKYKNIFKNFLRYF